jgi:glucose-6-phosphate isomerase/transaldolase/glucose-6-phosphate isomerase
VFVNPPDIGGRYSVLSYFGLVPAALIGVDLDALLSRADCMREGAASCVAVEENPAAYLGATMAALAQRGRDKLTIVASPSVASFGLWAEQLIAESTGKEGKGIVPVAGERLGDPDDYGDDRLFVHLRMEGDANDEADAALERIRAAGHPVVTLALHDRYDLGAEFFRWELATAVAGAVLGINPFDQPNVQEAKDVTAAVLREYQASGSLPTPAPVGSLDDLLAGARPGDYLAIMAYVRPTPEADRALSEIRARVMSRHRIATTVGYGPRFLHSTGQLHKGGPTNALFLQVTADHESDVPVPGAPYTFGVLADAQALGDLRVLRGLGRPVARVHLGDAADLSERLGEMARGA